MQVIENQYRIVGNQVFNEDQRDKQILFVCLASVLLSLYHLVLPCF